MSERVVVGAKGWPQPPQLAWRDGIWRRATLHLVLGILVVVLAGLLLWGYSLRGSAFWVVFAVALTVVGVVIVGASVFTLSRIQLVPTDRRVPITLPYAFAVEDDEVVFPEYVTWAEERWPLSRTSATAGKVLDLVTLRCPGRRPRRFFAMTITTPTVEAAKLVNDRRDDLVR